MTTLMVRRLFTAGAAIATAAALGMWSTPIAHADTELGLSDVLVLRGTATITADGTTLGCGDPVDANGELSSNVDLRGGCGNFGFTSSTCAAASDGDTPAVSTSCGVSSNGGFTNIVCGTGNATGTAAITSPAEDGTAKFTIIFAGTVGVLTGTETDTTGDSVGPTDTLVGVVDLGPAAVGLSPDGNPDCTDAFAITAVVLALDA